MKALVLGAGGRLGSEIFGLVPDAVRYPHAELSITDVIGLDRALVAHQPQVVFNCAAYNAVDRAEDEPELARHVNAEGARLVATACLHHGVRLVHFSTNFVFDGTLGRPYLESDRARPLSVYGTSKLEGETAVLDILPGAVVIRTAALFGDPGSGIGGASFPERILARARDGQRLRVVSDQQINPTYALDLAHAAIEIAGTDIAGVVHVVSSGCTGWDQFARAVLAELAVGVEVESVASADLSAPARRPPNGCLESERTRALRPWREGLHAWATRRARDRGAVT